VDLNFLWFVLLGVLLTGYALLDGFDLGVGILHLAARKDEHRRVLLNSIGPIWDGNEVWLVTFGGALFAAFPNAYATVFSGFYTAFMLLLFALISRAVSMEFRSKLEAPAWRQFWDVAFCAASGVATLLFGVAIGNAMRGMPIGPDGEYHGRFLRLLHPYTVLVGLMVVALFAMHGAVYLNLKTTGELQQRVRSWFWKTFWAFLVLYAVVTVYTLLEVPLATRNFRIHPWAWGVVALSVLAIANIPRAIYHERPGYAFLSSCATIAGLTFLLGIALFPELVHSSLRPEWSLDIYNAASSPKTLAIMAVIATIGMPFVLAYTSVIYWVFRGKVQLGKFSY
jgi:cytochrome bd ubiquinol oxidase subunit II